MGQRCNVVAAGNPGDGGDAAVPGNDEALVGGAPHLSGSTAHAQTLPATHS